MFKIHICSNSFLLTRKVSMYGLNNPRLGNPEPNPLMRIDEACCEINLFPFCVYFYWLFGNRFKNHKQKKTKLFLNQKAKRLIKNGAKFTHLLRKWAAILIEDVKQWKIDKFHSAFPGASRACSTENALSTRGPSELAMARCALGATRFRPMSFATGNTTSSRLFQW